VRWILVVVASAGCGRVNFERTRADDASPLIDGIGGPDDVAIDTTLPTGLGCADGEREAFVDETTYPTIAGCAATWSGTVDLAVPVAVGSSCGDDLGPCSHPRLACALGWHPCVNQGDLTELQVVTGAQCRAAGAGRFVAAASHASQAIPCAYAMPFTCRVGAGATGAQPICCGTGCSITGCPDGVWPGETYQSITNGQPCAQFPSTSTDGILCCPS
jgi:hypothetical protein